MSISRQLSATCGTDYATKTLLGEMVASHRQTP
jgi:hypothetical protein